jgi:hypothetical protein
MTWFLLEGSFENKKNGWGKKWVSQESCERIEIRNNNMSKRNKLQFLT